MLSTKRLERLFIRRGERDQTPAIEAYLTTRGTTLRQTMLGAIAGFDAERWCARAGVAAKDLEALRARATRSRRT